MVPPWPPVAQSLFRPQWSRHRSRRAPKMQTVYRSVSFRRAVHSNATHCWTSKSSRCSILRQCATKRVVAVRPRVSIDRSWCHWSQPLTWTLWPTQIWPKSFRRRWSFPNWTWALQCPTILRSSCAQCRSDGPLCIRSTCWPVPNGNLATESTVRNVRSAIFIFTIISWKKGKTISGRILRRTAAQWLWLLALECRSFDKRLGLASFSLELFPFPMCRKCFHLRILVAALKTGHCKESPVRL